MTTALQLWASNTNDATLSNGRDLVIASGAPATTPITTKCGNVSTGYGQLHSKGSAAGWGNAGTGYGSIQAPDGTGFILPIATLALAGNQIPSGPWTMRVRGNVSVGSATVDMYVPVYKYNGGVYGAALFTLSLLGQTLGASANFDFAAANESLISFVSGDQIYYEVWYNITANNTGNAAATVGLVESQSTTVGAVNSTNLLTPGYQLIPIQNSTSSNRRGGRVRGSDQPR